VVVEFGFRFSYHSLALISDAGHNLSDVASLMLAFRLAKVKSNRTFTYGYRKSTILVSLLNSVILLPLAALLGKAFCGCKTRSK
jgi:cobalt-zinc-cadmium efflux system protein